MSGTWWGQKMSKEGKEEHFPLFFLSVDGTRQRVSNESHGEIVFQDGSRVEGRKMMKGRMEWNKESEGRRKEVA